MRPRKGITIDKIKEEIPIDVFVESIGGRVKGSSWTEWQATICPFHDDSVASSSVNRSTNRFVCHACGVSGDVIDLAQELIQGTIQDAMEWLAKEYRVR